MAIFFAPCGGQQAPDVPRVSITQDSWDTLDVTLPAQEATRAVEVTVFDASHDTLYVGPPARIGIPDAALGDAEPLLVEVCARTAQRLACEQEGLRASPKRVVLLENDWDLPDAHDPTRGRYALRLAVERQRFDDDTFEQIDARAGVRAHVVATVDGHSDAEVEVPLTGANGVVNLTSKPGYRDFAFHLRSARVDGRPAAVTFAVHARLQDGPPVRVATHTHYVTPPTRAEQALQVEWFAEQAGAQLLNVLDPRRAYYGDVFVDDWRYQPGLGRYTVEMEVRSYRPGRRWRGGALLQGTLQVRRDGTEPRYELTCGNRRALRLWERQELGPLLPMQRFYPLEVLPRIPAGAQTADAGPADQRQGLPRLPGPAHEATPLDRGEGHW